MTAPAHPGFGRPTPKPTGNYRWVYLWGWPLRAMHWLAALAIVVLAVTGFYIGRPMSAANLSVFLGGNAREAA